MVALNTNTTFDGKLTCAFKNDMKNYSKFSPEHVWKSKKSSLMGSFYPKQKLDELNIYSEVLCHDNEEWYPIWTEIDLSVQNWHEAFDEFWPKYSKISKICTLTGCFWPKYIMFEQKKSIEKLCLMALNTDTTFDGKLTCAFKNGMRNYCKFSPEHVWKSKNLKFDGTLLSKVETVWA